MENIVNIDFTNELKNNFVAYAGDVIKNRAIPDCLDGLKPVQRRILYCMYKDRFLSSGKYIKNAKIIGSTMGTFHPHGDMSIADALNRMAQDFNLPIPFIDGHGNYGTIDGDPAASYRYILGKLSKFAEDIFFKDIDFDTVDWIDNYEGTELEPVVLPARFPTVLLTGSSGIAVGMATNFFTYNLNEICDAIVALIKNKEDDIFKYILGPDFPLGGNINTTNLKDFSNNKAPLLFRNTIELEEEKKNKCLIMKTICYGTDKTKLLTEIANKVNDGKITGITNIRDESNQEGIRVVFELADNVDPKMITKSIYDNTSCECRLSNNMNVIHNGKPKQSSLNEILFNFIEFRRNVVTKRTKYKLNVIKNRVEILEGILLALKHSDEVIKIVKTSESPLKKLQTQIGFTERQADYVFNMPVRRFGTIEVEKIKEEKMQQLNDLKECENILSDEKNIDKIIIDETNEIKNKYGYSRKTNVFEEFNLELKQTIKEQKIVVQVLKNGLVKAVSVELKDKYINENEVIIDENYPVFQFEANTFNSIALFTNKGNRYQLELKNVLLLNMGKSPKNITEYCDIQKDEKIIAITEWDISDDKNIFCLGKNGLLKKQDNETIRKGRDNNYIIYDIERGGELIDVVVTESNDDLSVCTKNGLILKKNMESIRPVGSRNSAGVNFIDIAGNDSIIGFVKNYDNISFATKNGYVKKISSSEIAVKNSGKQGMIAIKLDDKDEVIFAGNKVNVILSNRTVKNDIDIEVSARATKGKQVDKSFLGIIKG